MAWSEHKRPVKKTCKGYGRKPHECLYDEDFPMHKRVFKSGKVERYAGSLCYTCRRAYQRELRRMNASLQGKGTRPQDVPWKKHNVVNQWMVVDILSFTEWFEDHLRRTRQTMHAFIASLPGVSHSMWLDARKNGHLTVDLADRFFVHADEPWMMSIMEDKGAVRYGERLDAA